MWNDEDNNPYGSFDRPSSNASNQGAQGVYGKPKGEMGAFGRTMTDWPREGFERPATPNSDDEPPADNLPEFVSRPRDLSDDDEYQQENAPRKKGVYESRIEQILYENPDLQIIITDAGKNMESGGSYIAYTIRTGVGSRPWTSSKAARSQYEGA